MCRLNFYYCFAPNSRKEKETLYKNKEKSIGIRKDTVILVGQQCINVRYSYTCVSDLTMLSRYYFKKLAENIQKSPKTCRRFLLSIMYGKIYRKALQDAVHLSSVSKRCGKMHRHVPKYVVALFCQKRMEK